MADEIQNYGGLKNKFIDWLKNTKKIDEFDIEKSGGENRAVAVYNDEFKQFLAQQKQQGDNAYVKNDIKFSSDMFDDLMEGLNNDAQMQGVFNAIDTDGSGDVSQAEKDAFFEKVKSVDGNAEDITATDVSGAFKQFIDGDMTLLNATPNAPAQPFLDVPDNGGTNPIPPKGDKTLNLDTYKAVDLNGVTADNVADKLETAKSNLATASKDKDSAISAEKTAMADKISAEQGYTNADKSAIQADEAFKAADREYTDAQNGLITKKDELDFANTTLTNLNTNLSSLVEPTAPTRPSFTAEERANDEEGYDSVMAHYQEEQALYEEAKEKYETDKKDLIDQIEKQTELVAKLEIDYQAACDRYATATEKLNEAVQNNKDASEALKTATATLAQAGKTYAETSKLANQKISQFNIAQGQVNVLEEKQEEFKKQEETAQ